ncbi:hypothetical protein F441_01390 [Phytophthora nicotianae CJ01A1]|uniref:Uncharacterized protein n=3 Tax=Phytophthora nicotianae TaxID=4792 RepID=W2QS34_PHYN3|nr:hypothetical protein PPTG_21917 [Phytophthora nicotianae INRA-310]ETN15284.1 hypothetical protein PPTG_21917 [Phytophthora nicotianae INRA-310]ETO84697.1 hypothetical protein F444_01410 [Phytophthora nicotianae P1976]ETP25750.1 hypothetical protein F441_01390 [Phytophthora nicotianae CJ01A1]
MPLLSTQISTQNELPDKDSRQAPTSTEDPKVAEVSNEDAIGKNALRDVSDVTSDKDKSEFEVCTVEDPDSDGDEFLDSITVYV